MEPFSAARTGPCLGDNDLEDIPSSSRVSAKEKEKMVNEMLKCTPDEYEQSLRGHNEAHVTPIMTLLAEVSILALFLLLFIQVIIMSNTCSRCRHLSGWAAFLSGPLG